MVTRIECQIHYLRSSLNMIPFLVEESLLPRENLGIKKYIKKIKTLVFYAREECVGEEHIKQNSKRFKHSLVADCLQFVFFLKKNKLQIHLVLRIPSTNFLLFSDFILKPKIPNTLEGILMLIHMLEKAFLLTFTYNKN